MSLKRLSNFSYNSIISLSKEAFQLLKRLSNFSSNTIVYTSKKGFLTSVRTASYAATLSQLTLVSLSSFGLLFRLFLRRSFDFEVRDDFCSFEGNEWYLCLILLVFIAFFRYSLYSFFTYLLITLLYLLGNASRIAIR